MSKIDVANLISGNQKIVRGVNRAAVLNLIREKQPISRVELAKLSELNKSTVSSIVTELLKEKFIHETKIGQSTGGRRPILLNLSSSEYMIGAIDFDPDFTYVALGDIEANIKHKKAIQTQKCEPEKFIRRCVAELVNLRNEHNTFNFKSVGISVPGIVDTSNGKVIYAPDLEWMNVDIRAIVRETNPELTGQRIMVENEANTSALAEQWFGDGIKNKSNIVFISEGVGTGIILDKKLMQGSHDAAGQFGHMTIFADGKPCVCGNRGCWEMYASNLATVKRYFGSNALEFDGKINQGIKQIAKLAGEGDENAIKTLRETGRYLGIGISNIIKAIDPEVIILGGVILAAWNFIYPEIVKEIQKRVFFNFKSNGQIIPSALKERSSLIGALTLVICEIFNGYKITR